MRKRFLTNKQAAALLDMPLSTFNAKRAEMGLHQVSIFSGRKGWRLVEREVLAVVDRLIAERDCELERARKAIEDASRYAMKRAR